MPRIRVGSSWARATSPKPAKSAIVHDLTTDGPAEATIASTSARSRATTITPFITTQWPGNVQTNG